MRRRSWGLLDDDVERLRPTAGDRLAAAKRNNSGAGHNGQWSPARQAIATTPHLNGCFIHRQRSTLARSQGGQEGQREGQAR